MWYSPESMGDQSILFSIFLIFTGAAIAAGLALFARQSMLVPVLAEVAFPAACLAG